MIYENKTYLASIKKAKELGYKEFSDSKAYLGKSFRKYGKKWIIFSPDHLLEELGLIDLSDLARLGYNVNDYYDHHPDSLAMTAYFENEDIEEALYKAENLQMMKEHLSYKNIDPDEVDDIYEVYNQTLKNN